MGRLLLLPAAIALVATGVAVGVHVRAPGEESANGPASPAPEPEVVVRDARGEEHVLTPEEAAARIERLEASLRRRRSAEAGEEAESAASNGESPATAPAGRPVPLPTKPDGTQYTTEELREIARSSTDMPLRRAAIRALRRDDSDEARTLLQGILADPATPPALRADAAQVLATPPHRDHLPEQLVTALAAETDPAVRRELALGVSRLRDREAWMSEIAGVLHGERDPEVRRLLFDAVARDARDPVARFELVGIAENTGAAPEERRMAIAALTRGRADAATVERVRPLLADADPRVRENAFAVLAGARSLGAGAISAALADGDPGVRRAALAALQQAQPGREATDEARAAYRDLLGRGAEMASADPDPSVRRAAIQQVGLLPRDRREAVLEAGRDDPDLFVRLTSLARSPEPVARQATDTFVGALDSKDAAVRDFAYRQLQRVAGVTAPYDARWNPKARAAAVESIRREIAGR